MLSTTCPSEFKELLEAVLVCVPVLGASDDSASRSISEVSSPAKGTTPPWTGEK